MCLEKNVCGRDAVEMRPRVGCTTDASRKSPEHDPIARPKRTETGPNGRPDGPYGKG